MVKHRVKGLGKVSKAEVDAFLELSFFLDDPTDVGYLISGSSSFSKTSLNIWKFTVHILLKPGLENFERYFTSMWDECKRVVVWAFFGIVFHWDWNQNWLFSSPEATAEFSSFFAWLILQQEVIVRNKELTSHHQQEEFGKDQKEILCVLLPPRILFTDIHFSWAMHEPPKDSESGWLAKDSLETNPITIKSETASHVAEQFSWVPLPYCSLPGCPFPIKSLALSAHVSPHTIHFQVLDKSPDHGKGVPLPVTYPIKYT